MISSSWGKSLRNRDWPALRARLVESLRFRLNEIFDLIEETRNHRFFDSLKQTDWSQYQLRLILIASVLVNLTELASPLYINIVYTSVLPSGSMSSLVVLSVGVVVLMLLGGWLRSVRLALTGADGARAEHRKRLEAYSHFLGLRLDDFLRFSPERHLQRLNSINLLRDESSLQSLTTAIDLAFSLLFVFVLFCVAGSVGLIAVIAILVYLYRALHFAREYEELSRRRDRLELETRTYQDKMVGSLGLIKSNGLGSQFLVAGERYQEALARERVDHNTFVGRFQAFSSLMSQITFAAGVTWGAILVVNDRLLVGALAAALLLLGKILSPWQQAMGLWNSYRRMSHSRDEYEALMAAPLESDGGESQLALAGSLTVARAGSPLFAAEAGTSVLIRDQRFGEEARQLFMEMIQITPAPDLMLNGLSVSQYQRQSLRESIIYVNPARAFFQGTLLENLANFQVSRFRRKALFWSFLCGLDAQINALAKGYNTVMGGSTSSGLSRDSHYLSHIVAGLSRSPRVLLVDLTDCSYGKFFIDALERLLKRCQGRTTVLISGGGLVLSKLCDQEVSLQASLQEAK